MESYIFQTVTWWIFVASLLASSGLQSPGATRPTERHDEGRLHGETQGLVLLHCPRASSLWDQPDLGVQSGQAEEHRHPHAGHCQVASCSLIFEQTRRCHPLTRCFPTRMKYALFHPFIFFFFLLGFSGARLFLAVTWPKTRLPSLTPHPTANSLLRSTATHQLSSSTTLWREVVNNIKVYFNRFFNSRTRVEVK